MKTAQRLTPADRNRAIDRLRALTAGATFLGVSATVGFSWVAAASNPGTQAASAAGNTDSSTSTTSTSSSTSSESSSSSSSSSSNLGSTQISGSTGRSAHASSGGS